MEHLRMFKIRFIGATDTKGARVSIKDLRNNNFKIISYDYKHNSIKDIAKDYLNKIGIVCLYSSEEDKFYYLLTDNFDIMIK